MSDLQFDKAEPAQAPDQRPAPSSANGPACRTCGAALFDYFDVNGLALCTGCKDRLVADRAARRPARFLKAALFGTGAALGSAVLYYAIAKITGYEIGLVAIVVGLAVGWAVHQGSGKRGGRAYQFLAMALTYTSICLSHAPALFEAFGKESKQRVGKAALAPKAPAAPAGSVAVAPAAAPPTAAAKVAAAAGSAPAAEPAAPAAAAEAAASDEDDEAEEEPAAAAGAAAAGAPSANAPSAGAPSASAPAANAPAAAAAAAPARKFSFVDLLIALGAILGLLLALPFLMIKDSPIGLLLIAIAIYEAWKLNREVPLSIAGPLQIKAAAPPEPAAAPAPAPDIEAAGA
jgi:hypothetical protein